MNYETYRKIIEEGSSQLDQRERVALCLICCTRLAPLYSEFARKEKWGDSSVLTKCRETANNWLKGSTVDLTQLSKKTMEVIPDTEDFSSVSGSYALSAGVTHAYLLDQIKKDKVEPIINVLQHCYDVVDFYVHEILDPECKGNIPDFEIENHNLMAAEIKWQLSQLNKIRGNQNLHNLVEEQNIEPILNIA
ncbi:MAG TPA: DUF416 family protein [Gammaproteobacteria bacterium]|nr:DUF416 family protein [Gammaproteobacteria bacterium]